MKILFLCVENAGRSQMAEGFAQTYAPPGTEIFSAGSTPAQKLNPVAVEAMREKGIEIGRQIPKGMDSLPQDPFDVAVAMGCGDACPAHRANRIIPWDIPNPKNQPIEAVREIRDQIEQKVRLLLAELQAPTPRLL